MFKTKNRKRSHSSHESSFIPGADSESANRHRIWNLATPDIEVYVDIEDHDIDVFVDIEYSNLDIDVTVFDIAGVVTKKTSIFTPLPGHCRTRENFVMIMLSLTVMSSSCLY